MKASLYGELRNFVSEGVTATSWPEPPALWQAEDGQRSMDNAVQLIECADRVGFDQVSFSEHHYNAHNIAPAPIVAGAFMASRIKHARIALLGPSMILNNPVRVAEELALLDNLTGGRIVVGVHRGTPNEFQVYGVNPEETRARATESMEIILKAWSETQPFSWEGRYFRYRTVAVWPRPVQEPHPPMFVLGNSRESCEFAARNHLGLGLAHGGFEINARSVTYYRQQCGLAGWQPTPENIIYRSRVYVAETDEEAARDIHEHAIGRRGPRMRATLRDTLRELDPNPFHTGGASLPGMADVSATQMERRGDDFDFMGSPETIVNQFKHCQEVVGAGMVDLNFYGPELDFEQTLRSLELFGEKALPGIHAL